MGENPKDAYDKGYDFAKYFARMKTKRIVMAFPFSKQRYRFWQRLKELGIDAKIAEGKSLGGNNPGFYLTNFHQFKGLEFDHVILMGLHDAQFPKKFLDMADETMKTEEELALRRLLYVAMTRAKETLTIVASNPLCRFLNF